MKKTFCIALMLVLVMGLTACGNNSESQGNDDNAAVTEAEEEFDLEEYEDQVKIFRDEANSTMLALYNMSNYESNYWNNLLNISGKAPSSDDLSERAFSWLEENSDYTQDSIEESDALIRDYYKDLILTDIEGKEAEELDAAVRDMYDAYTAMYTNVTAASGDLNSFKSATSSAVGSFNKADDTIKLLLDIED